MSAACLPWVGPRFAEHRVVAVAINQNHSGYFYGELEQASQQISGLRAGRKQVHRSDFPRRTAETLHTVLAHLDGSPMREPTGEDFAVALERSARVQAVMCSPATEVSTPPGACGPTVRHTCSATNSSA